MKQLTLLAIGCARLLNLHLAPEIRDELLTRMAEAIETVFKAQRGWGDDAATSKDPV